MNSRLGLPFTFAPVPRRGCGSATVVVRRFKGCLWRSRWFATQRLLVAPALVGPGRCLERTTRARWRTGPRCGGGESAPTRRVIVKLLPALNAVSSSSRSLETLCDRQALAVQTPCRQVDRSPLRRRRERAGRERQRASAEFARPRPRLRSWPRPWHRP